VNLKELRSSRFLRDSTTLQVGALCLSAGNLLGLLALTHVLGAQNQGEFYLAIALYSFLWFLVGMGLYPVTISHVAKAIADGKRELVAHWLGYLGKGTFLLGLVCLALAWFVLPPLVELWFKDSTQDPSQVARNAGILCLIPLAEVPRVVAMAGLTGARRMGSLARVENGQEASRVLLVVVGALATGDARGPVVGLLLASCVGSLLGLEAWLREARAGYLPGPWTVFKSARVLPLRAGLKEGLQMGLVRNIDAFGVQILPTLILGHFGSARWVAYLRVAQRFTDVVRLMMKGISQTVLPVLSELRGGRDPARLRHVYWRASGLSGLVVGAGLLLSLIVAPTIIERCLPRDFRDPVWRCLLILAPGVLVVGFSVANDIFYLVTGTLKVGIWLSVVGLVVNTTVVALLAWQLPTVGVAMGLSFTFLWSVTHLAYAAWWFHRNLDSARPEGLRGAPSA
jgi:O-antigen/teichoic acid export membrane protein